MYKQKNLLLNQVRGYKKKKAMTYSTTSAVPSALQGLTSVFGMGTGGTPALESPSKSVSRVCSTQIQ